MPEINPEIHTAIDPRQHKIMIGIRQAAQLLHQHQNEAHLTRSIDRCIAYQETIAQTMQELGFHAHVEVDPDADVTYKRNHTTKPRGHAIGFITDPTSRFIVAYDASIDQARVSKGNELVRIYGSNKPTKAEQAEEITTQLRRDFGGDWDPANILLGLEINQC